MTKVCQFRTHNGASLKWYSWWKSHRASKWHFFMDSFIRKKLFKCDIFHWQQIPLISMLISKSYPLCVNLANGQFRQFLKWYYYCHIEHHITKLKSNFALAIIATWNVLKLSWKDKRHEKGKLSVLRGASKTNFR